MCGKCSQCMDHSGFALAHCMCAFPVYTAQTPGCSAGELSKVGPGFRVLPRSKFLRFWFSGTPQRHRLRWACVLCPSQVQGAQATRCLVSTLSQAVRLNHLPSPSCLVSWAYCKRAVLRCAVCLLWGADLWLRPSWQISTIQDPRKTRLATGSLLTVWWRMLSLRLRLPLAFQLWPSPACLSASGRGLGWSAASYLSFVICSILCSVSRPGCALG